MKKNQVFWIIGLFTFLTIISVIDSNFVQAQAVDEYVGPEACKECHSTNFVEWEESKHSQAFENPEFQQDWAAEANKEECLQCHTTGYDASIQDYASEGITCEACHGAGLEMKVDTSPELCGSCHTGEYGQNKFEEFKEGTHYESGVTCVNCHVYEDSHTFELESKACASCHTDEDIHSRSMIGDLQTRARNAENLATQIEEEHENLLQEIIEMEKRTALVTQVTYLGAGALVILGIVVVLLFMRQRRKSLTEPSS